ncbi:MAG: GNAT family N-acetyltransferase [Luteimonas sp.]
MATPVDAPLLVELGARTFRETYRDISDNVELDDYIAKNFTLRAFQAQLSDPNARLLVGMQAGRAIGYGHLRMSQAPACVVATSPVEISRLYLEQSVKGNGHGSALMRALLDQASQWECDAVWLGIYAENHRARAFYERWRFKEVGHHDFMFGGTLYSDPVMSRLVHEAQIR